MKKQTLIDMLIPLSVAVIMGFFATVLGPSYDLLKWKFYDFFLGMKPSVAEDPRLVIVNIGDKTIENLRMYPLSRDFIAQGVTKIAELGASVLAIDSEFIDVSPRGIQEAYLKEKIPDFFSQTFDEVINNNQQLVSGILDGQIDRPYAKELLGQLNELTDESKNRLLERVQGVIKDNDLLLGGAARFFGSVHGTITPPDADSAVADPAKAANAASEPVTALADPAYRDLVLNGIPLKKITLKEKSPFQAASTVSVAIYPVLAGMRGAGSVKQAVDDDGVRRRVDLMFEYEGRFYPQLGFSALLQWLGDPLIEIYSDRIVLIGALLPGGQKENISIPVNEKGQMLLHWPRKSFIDSYTHLEFIQLLKYDEYMEIVADNLKTMESFPWGYLYQSEIRGLLGLLEEAEQARLAGYAEGGTGHLDAYRDLRLQFIDRARAFLSGKALEELDGLYRDEMESWDASSAEFKDLEGTWTQTREIFRKTGESLNDVIEQRSRFAALLKDALVVLGYSGKSTSDIGVNPFEKEYMNVGTMSTVANTVIQKKFLVSAPWWWSFLVVLPIVFLIPWIFNRLTPGKGFALGLGGLFFLTAIYFTIFVVTGIYLDSLMAIAMIGLTFLVAVFVNFRRTNSQKTFIKDAFGQYLSGDVIEELLLDPDKLKLGGEKREMTAIFTDVKGFSTISEQMDPVDLVTLLNEYLTAMSDIILGSRGTIDKYEGDAIIAFFGAPHHLPDHAKRACRSAILMKKTEIALNTVFLEKKMTPSLLYTRIGINTGDMVVGNMGTMKKKNYTMMGNAVNLAARLEGVNKQYQTGILISESTAAKLDGEFTLRQLARVRVVGVSTPLRLYELVDEAALTEPYTLEKIQIFENALTRFESRDFSAAESGFLEVLKHTPWDGPGQIYLQKTRDMIKNPPPDDWDGVENMTTK